MEKKDLTTFLQKDIVSTNSKNKILKPQKKKDPYESFLSKVNLTIMHQGQNSSDLALRQDPLDQKGL